MSKRALYASHHPFLLLVFVAVFVLITTMIFFELTGTAFRELGLGRIGAVVVIGGSLLGSLMNIPVARVKTEVSSPIEGHVTVFGKPYKILSIDRSGTTIVAVNVGGAFIPSAVSIYLLSKNLMLLPQALLGVVVVGIVTHLVARPTPGVGIVVPALISPLTAAMVALFVPSNVPSVVAYVSGVLGTLIGADLTNLSSISRIGAGVVSIGGAGTFDGVFLSGILAVILA